MMEAEELIRETARLGINYAILADRVGISRSMVSKVIHGHRRFSDVTEHLIRKFLKHYPIESR